MSDPTNLKDQAARCRRLAGAMTDPQVVRDLTTLADEYEAEARAPERQGGLDEPLRVEEVNGEVAVVGPARMAGSMTPNAAKTTGERMIEAARRAESAAQGPSEFKPDT